MTNQYAVELNHGDSIDVEANEIQFDNGFLCFIKDGELQCMISADEVCYVKKSSNQS